MNALMLAKKNKYVEIVDLIENQVRRNRNWEYRKALMLVLAESKKYLPSSSSSALDTERVVLVGEQTQIGIQRVGVAQTTNTCTMQVLCDMFLLQHIMRYI